MTSTGLDNDSIYINSKLRKLQSAGRAFTYKQNLEKMREEGPLSIDNPAYMAAAQTLSAVANVPLDRALRKLENLRASVDSDTEMWQRISLMLGYSKWDVGLIDQERKQKNVDAELRRFFEKSLGEKTIDFFIDSFYKKQQKIENKRFRAAIRWWG